MYKLFKFFKSVRLAVVLFIVLAATSIVATLIPQNQDVSFYTSTYSGFIAGLILALQLDHFFRSLIFLAAAVLLFLNLGVCAGDRLYRQVRKRRRWRFGPDLVHIGLLVLLVGGVVTSFGRLQGFTYLAKDDTVKLPAGYELLLKSFQTLYYPDGRPKAWISEVDVYQSGKLIKVNYPIEVNHPLKVGKVNVYQTSYGKQPRVTILDKYGKSTVMKPDDMIYADGGEYQYVWQGPSTVPATNPVVAFERIENNKVTGVEHVSAGQQLGPYTIKSIKMVDVTGLRAVRDPGYLPVFIGFIMAVCGLALTFIQKFAGGEI